MSRRSLPPAVALDGSRIAYRPATLAALLDLSRATVYRLIEQGELPASRIGGAVVIEHTEVLKYLRRMRVPARAIAEERQ